MTDYIKGSIWGLVVGDALGVPVEFKEREVIRKHPVTDMMEYGTHYQPKGTWSDDSSMMLCTLDSLGDKGEIDYDDIMAKFASWLYEGEYTPYGEAFDYGGATCRAIERYRNGVAPLECGGCAERDNGNGSLMRILPVVLHLYENHGHFKKCSKIRVADTIHQASSLTHGHSTSTIGCGLYGFMLGTVINFKNGEEDGESLLDALECRHAWKVYEYCEETIAKYSRLKDMRAFAALPEDEIKSGGYVVNTLEAAMWCFLNTDNFADCVLKAVNLGNDTDTTAAVAGSIAGAYYGMEGIPTEWLNCLAKKEWIAELIEKFEKSLPVRTEE